jgi:glycosyltransferase involved in cell wall biosynthesis
MLSKITDKEITTVHNGVNIDVFRPTKITRKKRQILFVARWETRKGLDILLKSLLLVKKRTKLLIVGPKSNTTYDDLVSSLIEQVRNKHDVEYLGAKTKEELVNLYNESTVFANPALYEPFGITNIESMACGLPVVASNRGGIPEIIQHGKNGFCIEPKCEVFAEHIEKLLSKQDIWKKFSDNGLATVRDRFDLQAITAKLIEIYKK